MLSEFIEVQKKSDTGYKYPKNSLGWNVQLSLGIVSTGMYPCSVCGVRRSESRKVKLHESTYHSPSTNFKKIPYKFIKCKNNLFNCLTFCGYTNSSTLNILEHMVLCHSNRAFIKQLISFQQNPHPYLNQEPIQLGIKRTYSEASYVHRNE